MSGNEPVWSISDVNAAVREIIENSMTSFWLHGEVGTLNIYRSGHVYLTLKDRECQLRATFFHGAERARALGLAVGMQVEAFGKLTVYPQRGDYQFNIRTLRAAGAGDLQRQFEEIKSRLAAEGLFDAARKPPLPEFPHTVGVVTSPDGAAVRDFLNIARRRAPWLAVRIYPAVVQGGGTAESVAAGVAFFNRPGLRPDVIVVTRGGGSMEDLWGFNSELLARAIAASAVPVVSAVGHEIDFTIADFAAAVRAPTPSAAAELVAPEKREWAGRLDGWRDRLRNALEMQGMRAARRCEQLAASYVFREPEHLLERHAQKLDDLTGSLERAWQQACTGGFNRLDLAAARLGALNPDSVLRRGFAILLKNDRSVADSVHKLAAGEHIRARLHDGEARLTVE